MVFASVHAMTDMVKTRKGKATTIELSDDVVKYLDSRFDQLLLRLATKDDVNEVKNDVSSLLKRMEEQCEKIVKQDEKIDGLEACVALLESHVKQLKRSAESQKQYSRRL